jgi:protoporphyrinogen/coproporphyrinogen III oxidase
LTPWPDEQLVERVFADISALLNIHTPPEMLTIKLHLQALPLYHGNYYSRCQAIRDLLQKHSGLSLQANYLGGVSIRDCLTNSKMTSAKIIEQLEINNAKESVEQASCYRTVPVK